jgi:hypothetical protein
MSGALALLCAAGGLFLAVLLVLAIVLWRSPVRLAQTITQPIERRLQELTIAVRESSDSQSAVLSDHERRIQQLEARLAA